MWVTDGSTDRTNELLAQYPEVTLVFSPERRGKAVAMEHGLHENTSPFVVFTDANTMLNSGALREIAFQFTKPGVSCVSGEKRVAARPIVSDDSKHCKVVGDASKRCSICQTVTLGGVTHYLPSSSRSEA
jgi:cellulose synthase/poly-beta-1,6-N-acetylglucosamine synthase-like glycosyltransferase